MVHAKGYPINCNRLLNFWPRSYYLALASFSATKTGKTEALPLLSPDHLYLTALPTHPVPKVKQLSFLTSRLFHALMHSGHPLLKAKRSKKAQQGCICHLHESTVCSSSKSTNPHRLKRSSSKCTRHVDQRSWEGCKDDRVVKVNSESSKVGARRKVTVSCSIMHGIRQAIWFNHGVHSFTEQKWPLSNCQKNPFSARSLILQGAPQDQDLQFMWQLNATKKKFHMCNNESRPFSCGRQATFHMITQLSLSAMRDQELELPQDSKPYLQSEVKYCHLIWVGFIQKTTTLLT